MNIFLGDCCLLLSPAVPVALWDVGSEYCGSGWAFSMVQVGFFALDPVVD